MTGFIRVKQQYGPTVAPSGTASPRAGAVKFGSGVADPASFNVATSPAGGFALSAHAVISATPVGSQGIVAASAALGGTTGLHKIETVAGGRITGTISGPSAASVVLLGNATPAVGQLLFAALSYDDATSRATLWTWTAAGGLTETTKPVPFVPLAASAFSVGHNGSQATFPGTVEQVTLWAYKIDTAQVIAAFSKPVDTSGPKVFAAAAVGLPGAQANTNAGTGSTRLLPAVDATISKGAVAGSPLGTTHRAAIATGAATAAGITVGTVVATSWGLSMRVLGVSAGSSPNPDILSLIRI